MIGFDSVELLPNKDKETGDADLILRLNQIYWIQLKSPNFFLSQSWQNIASSLSCIDGVHPLPVISDYEMKMQNITRGFAGILKAKSDFVPRYYKNKVRKSFSDAQGQLKTFSHRKIFAFDIRRFHGSESHVLSLVYNLFAKKNSFLDGVLILSNDPEKLHHGTNWSRIICLPNTKHGSRIDEDDWKRLGYTKQIQLYESRPFVIFTKVALSKGWNDWLEFRGKRVLIDDIEIGSL